MRVIRSNSKRSRKNATRTYIGYTQDLRERIQQHNKGETRSTQRYRPWEIVWYCAFRDKRTAKKFERYLKTGSGKAFLKKRFLL
jgi:predicted GIY-YIG superfamily endonuclease